MYHSDFRKSQNFRADCVETEYFGFPHSARKAHNPREYYPRRHREREYPLAPPVIARSEILGRERYCRLCECRYNIVRQEVEV